MIKICFINGSPRNKVSMSDYLIEEIIKTIDSNNVIINKLHINDIINNKSRLDDIKDVDKLILVGPLYVDTLPGNLMYGLYEIEKYIRLNNINNIDTYAVFNCGFLEGDQNHIALQVLKNFCDRCNLSWKFGIGIGAGVFMNNSKSMPIHFGIKKPIYDAILILSDDIQEKEKYYGDNLFVNPNISKFLFKIVASGFWIISALKNNVKLRQLKSTPYED